MLSNYKSDIETNIFHIRNYCSKSIHQQNTLDI